MCECANDQGLSGGAVPVQGGAAHVAYWEGVLDGLALQPFQLRELVRLYQEYLAKLQPADTLRAVAVEELAQVGRLYAAVSFFVHSCERQSPLPQ